MYAYNTFRSMVESLRRPEAEDAVDLLRSRFLGFPGDVTVLDEQDLADSLTAESVLLRPDALSQTYRMTLVLVDGLLRRRVIAYKFRSAPPTEPPFDNSRQSLDVLSAVYQTISLSADTLLLGYFWIASFMISTEITMCLHKQFLILQGEPTSS